MASYEDYVNEYTKLYQESLSGGNFSLNTYNSMLKKALDLQEVLTNEELSSKQYQRLLDIQNKMADAVMN